MKLSFIQMSDIHFRKHSGDPYDVDNPIRKAAINDLANAKQHLDKVDGLLICGDIAFSGQEDEYKVALDFIDEVAGYIDIPRTKVFCVAGNHDVDQNLIKRSMSIQGVQQMLVEQDREDWQKTDTLLRNIQQDVLVEDILYQALKEYNAAFGEMASNYTADRPNWEHSIDLDERRHLVLHGMNSVLVSSHLDHQKKDVVRKMVMNYGQIPSPVDKDTIYLSMCHHPPELWENQELIEIMDEIVKIQLYGHIHEQAVDANEQRIRIYSGALQPERGEGWKPQYNWIVISTEKDVLNVDIYPRVFDKTKFVADVSECDDGAICKHCELSMGGSIGAADKGEKKMAENRNSEGVRVTDNTLREIVYQLYQLSKMKQKRLKDKYPDREFEFSPEGIDNIVDWVYNSSIGNEFLEVLGGL